MTQPDQQANVVPTPKHIAIIMDGNGRWAEAQGQPRVMGHRAGVKSVRDVVALCRQHQVESLTLFAFSSENWRRPEGEVKLLMRLFSVVLRREAKLLKRNDVRLKIIGDVSGFDQKLQVRIRQAEADTAHCQGMVLNIAANYGGRWDVVNAARKLADLAVQGEIVPSDIDEVLFDRFTSLSDQPEVDLLIRTGGEQRISNFLLWQCAYSELFFSDALWPDFGETALQEALDSFASRQRRFGLTSAQVATVE
ncbi:polyprenyl diphosphate synthase [Ferrimonas balearica]|uniref:polyprenyl diphosphate synthase n=1 Tax=Ferrimonas balearica TaxID=44012 RepID=UPI001C99CC26|nr:polyprenyl diphosphate synthase [Ferrimonas balearica]MBY5921376.1 di-trans,poly-cis-decaprenylcistransferase [Ferrimonas balearica]MBY5995939.1 di-trans,poly-cis-decaprenylcistransferase [Ferrimonas balearica]